MTLQQLLILIVTSLVVAIVARVIAGTKESQSLDVEKQFFRDKDMPRDLRKATLLINEQTIQSRSDKIGRSEQAFQLKNGKIVILDTKVREKHKVYPSDIKQLKKYACILQGHGYAKPSYGYIRIVPRTDNTRNVYYFRVQL